MERAEGNDEILLSLFLSCGFFFSVALYRRSYPEEEGSWRSSWLSKKN